MKFLITNDDGIVAPGIRVLANAASHFGEVVIVAPEEAHSGCGHRVTIDREISIRKQSENWWAIGGTPADCTRVGLREIAADCDWVLAGVNAGANLGVDIFMSGTVAAVREAALLKRSGAAFSLYHAAGSLFNWEFAERTTVQVLEQILSESSEIGHFWNVNLPDQSTIDPESHDGAPSLIDCPVGRQHLPVEFSHDGTSVTYKGVYQDRPRDPGDDVDVCFGGNVAMTRLSVW